MKDHLLDSIKTLGKALQSEDVGDFLRARDRMIDSITRQSTRLARKKRVLAGAVTHGAKLTKHRLPL